MRDCAFSVVLLGIVVDGNCSHGQTQVADRLAELRAFGTSVNYATVTLTATLIDTSCGCGDAAMELQNWRGIDRHDFLFLGRISTAMVVMAKSVMLHEVFVRNLSHWMLYWPTHQVETLQVSQSTALRE